MIFIFRILGYIAIIGTGICVLLIAFYLWFFVRNALDKGKYTLSDFAGWIYREFGLLSPKAYLIFVVASLFATLITNTAVHDLIELHNLHLKPDGTYCFYVKISDYNNTYTLPAQISIEEYDIEKGEKTYTKRMYFIEKFTFRMVVI